WSFKYREENGNPLSPNKLTCLSSNELIVLASDNSLLKINLQGEIEEARRISNLFTIKSMVPSDLGGLLICGIYKAPGELDKGIILRTDDSLNIVWSRLLFAENFQASNSRFGSQPTEKE